MVGLDPELGQLLLFPQPEDTGWVLDFVHDYAFRHSDYSVVFDPHRVTPYLALAYLKGASAKAAKM